MSNELLEYRAAIYRNSETFLLKHKDAFLAFADADRCLSEFCSVISKNRSKDGKSLVGLIPLLMIIQRQGRNAFHDISTYRSYQTWVLLRPALESALIMGKWVDDQNNFTVWKNRDSDRKSYNNVYWGKGLISQSLPSSEQIYSVLGRVNDDFMHANPSYYQRHTSVEDIDPGNVGMYVSYNDSEDDHLAHMLAFLHVFTFLVVKIGELLSRLFEAVKPPQASLDRLQAHFGARALAVAREAIRRQVLEDLGLWPNERLQGDAPQAARA